MWIMSPTTFDTLKFVERLEKADAAALSADLRELRAEMMGEMKLTRWMVAALVGLSIANFAK
jgi:hypothetical protein